MAAIEQQSGITTWMSERPRCDQMHEPFGQGCLQRPERLFGNDRLLPFIHLVIERLCFAQPASLTEAPSETDSPDG